MCAKPYEQYLVARFIGWAAKDINPGFRYQFKSPDVDNAARLHQAFLELADTQSIEIDGIQLPFVLCGGVRLIPVLHGENAFTENYITRLRDTVAGREGEFSNSALLIIHNSLLDTITNSACDVAAPGAIWHPQSFVVELELLLKASSEGSELSVCLLKDQLKVIIEEESTVFGFAPLYKNLTEGVLEFSEFGLFDDPIVCSMKGQATQVRKRLDENRALRKAIEFTVEHFPNQLESMLRDFSSKFISEHFVEKMDWSQLEFQVYKDEMKASSEQKLELESIEIENCVVYDRVKSQTKAGQKEHSLLVEVPPGQQEVLIKFAFLGRDLETGQIKISHNKTLEKTSAKVERSVKHSWATLSFPFGGQPMFVSIELKRNNRAEEYRFRCLFVEQGRFYLDEIKNFFRVDPNNRLLTLLMKENTLRLSRTGDYSLTLRDSDEFVDCETYENVDFEQVANQTDVVQFVLRSGLHDLKINVEGPAAEAGVTVPLLFDRDRFGKLFHDRYDAEFSRVKNKIIIDNSEISVVGLRQQLLMAESKIVSEQLLFVSDTSCLSVADFERPYPRLFAAYSGLFNYFHINKSLPSLVAWGPNYQDLVKTVVDAYEAALQDIPLNTVLTVDQKQLLSVGLYQVDEREKISPLHPLVLAYHYDLVRRIVEDKDVDGKSSFSDLPDVTRERLVASGLIPFLFSAEGDFAHVVPVKDDVFWLDVVPRKHDNHSFVRRLVRDKLEEFTEAYAGLFRGASRGALIVNAINQAEAHELFRGLLDHFRTQKDRACAIHVNFYDDELLYNEFDHFAESSSYDELKSRLGLSLADARSDADTLIDLVRSHLTYSKFETPKDGAPLEYAHLAFFSNSAPVDSRPIQIDETLSGILCDGLIAGEASETMGPSYFTAFGLRGVETDRYQPLRLARLIGGLWQPARQANALYIGTGIGLAVGAQFKDLLGRCYSSALWTTIIDPKVTLDFFSNQQDVVLIHYSDQYTSAAGYDAITVTKQVDLFKKLLRSDNLLGEFNAFNGEWLLKMLTASANERKEKAGIIGAYKFISSVLRESDICWVPLSVAEMIRVSGNVGLKMTESDFTRMVHGYRKGAISDDVLFVGFKDGSLYLLPLEVKTGVRPDYKYAGQQATELKRYLTDVVLAPKTLASKLYRGLFVRQVLMQVEKLRLYNVLSEGDLSELINRREWWLRGEYDIGMLEDYPSGFVVAHVENDTCIEPTYTLTTADILQVELPYGLLDALINASSSSILDGLVADMRVPAKYKLASAKAVELETTNSVYAAAANSAVEPADAVKKDVPVQTEHTGDPLPTPKVMAAQVVDIPTRHPEPAGPTLKVLFGHDVLRNAPVYWEPTNTAKFMHTNTGIIGTMGTGKTQFTKSVIAQLIQYQSANVDGMPIGVLIFDYKSDYVDKAFIEKTNAKKFKLHGLPFNPLSLYGDMPMLPLHTATSFAETMTRAFGLGQKQQLRLRKVILDAYELAGIEKADPATWGRVAPTIKDVWELFLSNEKVEEDSLYAALDSLASYEIFESDPLKVSSLYDLVDGVSIIELAGYSIQIQNLVVALTLDQFYAQMQKKGKPAVRGDLRQMTKIILVDEADNFMSQDFSTLRKILKEGREYGVGTILSTQDISHFKTGDNNYASYVLTWIVHRVSEIKNADIKAIFNKDDKGEQEHLMESIRKLEKHFSLYIDGDKRFQKIRDKAFWELDFPD